MWPVTWLRVKQARRSMSAFTTGGASSEEPPVKNAGSFARQAEDPNPLFESSLTESKIPRLLR